jgi:predicted RND superfamily exporter protein
MKTLLYIILLFGFIINSYGQNTLSITFEPETDFFGSDYHLIKNDSLIYTNCSKKNDFKVLFDLENGSYTLKYNTAFGIDSLSLNLDEKIKYHDITLKTENLNDAKLKETKSEIESLLEDEQITINYSLGGCFVAKDYKLTLTKHNEKYYKIKKSKRKRISQDKVAKLIRFEKLLRNLNLEENLDGVIQVFTCSEYISLEKNSQIIYSKNIFCGDWSESSEIAKWIK